MKKIFCKIDICLYCRSCELACAVEHSETKTLVHAVSEYPLSRYRIKVEQIDDKGSLNHFRTIAIQCRHCEEPLCVQACISGGIHKDEKTGNIMIDNEKCAACWSCIMICPFGVISRHEEKGLVVKCDLCSGREIPACVEACPTGALVFCEKEEIVIEFEDK